MNKEEDFPSDSDQSDADFCPNNESDSDIPSNEESDFKGSDSDDEETHKKNKNKKKRKVKTKNHNKEIVKNEIIEEINQLSEEDDKKKSDDLWASFLSDVNDAADTKNFNNKFNEKSNSIKAVEKDLIKNCEPEKIEEKKIKVTEILEFAGEKIEVTKEIIPENESKCNSISINKKNINIGNKFSKIPLKRPAGGITSVLGQLGKKTKISVLEKSKLDWEGFKSKEGLKEELKTFNKGKDGYLEKQDFLQRTDLRQFEIEKSLRQTKRKH